MKRFLMAAGALSLMASTAMADEVYLDQSGVLNTFNSSQDGTSFIGSAATPFIQSGAFNTTDITQEGDGNIVGGGGVGGIAVEIGVFNDIIINQVGSDNVVANILHVGVDNDMDFSQDGEGNLIDTPFQFGFGNDMNASQAGTDNYFTAEQVGLDNLIETTQVGSDNSIEIRQGTLSADSGVNGPAFSSTIEVAQFGADNSFIGRQSGVNQFQSTTQIGVGNSVLNQQNP